jgi:uncharacterized membrane protein YbaN (DUF454 family)
LLIKKYLFIAAGFTSLSFGVAGIFLPILPTTPFLLLSAACFLKSSKSLYKWITNHKIFGSYISNYIKFRAVTTKSKILSILFLWVMILSSAVFFTNIIWLRILLVLIASGVTTHILMMRTLTREMKKNN